MIIQEYRQAHGLTQAQFAAKIGTVPSAVSQYERKTRVPKRTIMTRIIAFTEGKVTANDFAEFPT